MNKTHIKLQKQKPLVGLIVVYPCPGIIESIGKQWDWIWIDGQHGELGYQDTLNMVRACDVIQKPAFVRVAWNDPAQIALVNDMAVSGIIVPCIDTPEQARAAITTAKFPPIGKRSFGGRRPNNMFGRTYSETANEDVMLIAMIESPEAVENANAIAAIEGIDGLLLGPDDVMLRRGYSMTTPRSAETLGEDMAKVARACRENGKVSMMVGLSLNMFKTCLAHDFDMITTAYDSFYLIDGSDRSRKMVDAVLSGTDNEVMKSVGGSY